MGNYLYSLSKVCSLAFLVNNRTVDLTCGYIVCLAGVMVEESFIMSQIKVCFRSILGHETFTVRIGIESTGVHIEIWVKFLNCNTQITCSQQLGQRGRYNTFSKRRCNPSRNKNIFNRHSFDISNIRGYKIS